ncbi:hypothetical protein ACFYZ8_12930 [Streptomyces sp. NPDC001668]|uniref:hypothetical protein n=1 Tax=unclassified Streptomyces TaxID=2593676 RepID=UPI0036B70153
MRRIVLRAVISLSVTAAGVLGYLYVHGDFQRWSDNSALDAACGGLLDRDVVRGVLGSGEVKVKETAEYKRYWDMVASCWVHVDGGGTAEIRVVDAASVGENVDSLYRADGSDDLAVPVGYGWSGVLGADLDEPEDVTVSLVLDCAEGSKAAALSITVETSLPDVTMDDPANRPGYARIATSTAAKVSKKQECGAELGEPVRRLGLPVSEDSRKPLRAADGTCSGIPTAQGVSVATETDRGGAPYEICRLSDADARARYLLKARFGPYAQEMYSNYQVLSHGRVTPSPGVPAQQRAADGTISWTSAKCRDGFALFTLQPYAATDDDRKGIASTPGRAYERSALKVFAERSAKAHGCSAPAKL